MKKSLSFIRALPRLHNTLTWTCRTASSTPPGAVGTFCRSSQQKKFFFGNLSRIHRIVSRTRLFPPLVECDVEHFHHELFVSLDVAAPCDELLRFQRFEHLKERVRLAIRVNVFAGSPERFPFLEMRVFGAFCRRSISSNIPADVFILFVTFFFRCKLFFCFFQLRLMAFWLLISVRNRLEKWHVGCRKNEKKISKIIKTGPAAHFSKKIKTIFFGRNYLNSGAP